MPNLKKLLPDEILRRYEVLNYNHAVEILTQSFPDEFTDIIMSLNGLRITEDEIIQSGGNESPIPPKFSDILEPLGWRPRRS